MGQGIACDPLVLTSLFTESAPCAQSNVDASFGDDGAASYWAPTHGAKPHRPRIQPEAAITCPQIRLHVSG